jgi:hypothetical protein
MMGRCGKMAAMKKNELKDLRKLGKGGISSPGPGIHPEKIKWVTEMLAKAITPNRNSLEKN